MMQLRDPLPRPVEDAKTRITRLLSSKSFAVVDASTETTGKDYLLKTWLLALACPVGVAIVHEGIASDTLANIYYELGWMQAYGKETIVVKIGDVRLPSDLVRTEYIPFDAKFKLRFEAFANSLEARADYYHLLASQVAKNPLLAVDYLRRAYLLTNKKALRTQAKRIFTESSSSDRAADSVERLLASF